jgi:hypothetical protein
MTLYSLRVISVGGVFVRQTPETTNTAPVNFVKSIALSIKLFNISTEHGTKLSLSVIKFIAYPF